MTDRIVTTPILTIVLRMSEAVGIPARPRGFLLVTSTDRRRIDAAETSAASTPLLVGGNGAASQDKKENGKKACNPDHCGEPEQAG